MNPDIESDIMWDENTVLVDQAIEEDRSATVWRYTSLPKLVNVLSESALFCEKMNLFEDPYEGRLSEASHERLKENYERIMDEEGPFESNIKLLEELRNVTYLNCWRVDDYEDYGMWHAYTNSSCGLAVKTSISRLVESIKSGDGYKGRLAIKKMDYIDYRNDRQESVGEGVFFPFRFKRIQHQNEKEVRLMVTDYPHSRLHIEESFTAPEDQPDIREISIDPVALIEEIRLHPESGSALKEATQNLITMSEFDLHLDKVQESSLKDVGR